MRLKKIWLCIYDATANPKFDRYLIYMSVIGGVQQHYLYSAPPQRDIKSLVRALVSYETVSWSPPCSLSHPCGAIMMRA